MIRSPVTLVGLAGIVFLVGGFVPASFNGAELSKREGLLKHLLTKPAAASVKGDRMAEPLPASRQSTVSTVELIGISQATIILRGRDGEVLYRSDPRTGITTFSKNTNLPVITLKEETQNPVAQRPATTRQEGTDGPQNQQQKKRTPVGCMGDVSPLVKASANRMPSLCLAGLDQSLS